MGEVDPDFIQPLEHQPKPGTLEAEGIPFIDLSPLNSKEPDASALDHLVSEIGDACKTWGFFQVINHGVPSQVRQRIETASKEFFALPKEEKKKASRDEANIFGYSDLEITKSVRDWKEIFDCTIENPTVVYASDEPDDKELRELTSQWPQSPPNLRQLKNSASFFLVSNDKIKKMKDYLNIYFLMQGDMPRICCRNAEANSQTTRANSTELRFGKRSIPWIL